MNRWIRLRTKAAAVVAMLPVVTILASATPAAQAPQDPTPAPSKDLLTIARREAERESATLHGRIKTLLNELTLRTDENDLWVESRIDEIARIGSLALPDLTAAMDYPDSGAREQQGTLANRALNAARAIARIPGQASSAEIVRLCREGGVNGKRNAAIAIGVRSDLSLFPVLRELCTHVETQLAALEKELAALPSEARAEAEARAASLREVVRQSLRSIGKLGGSEAATVLAPYVEARDADCAAAAITGLALQPEARGSAEILKRLEAESVLTSPSERLLTACFEYFDAHPDSAALDLAGKGVGDTLRTAETRSMASAALRSIAKKSDASRRRAVEFLRDAVRTSNGELLETIALALRDLGDTSGIEAVLAPLDKQIKDEPKNFALLYQRGELCLRLKEYKQARRDLKDGLNKEKEPRQPDRIYIALARCSAALGEYREAEQWLNKLEKKLGDQDFSTLPRRFPEFEAMAAERAYERWFEAPK